MSMDNLFSILSEEKGYKDFFIAHRIGEFIKKHWPEIAGKLALELKVVYFRNGILGLESSNQMWVTEVAFYEKELLQRLNDVVKAHGRRFKLFKLKVTFARPDLEKTGTEPLHKLPDLRDSPEKLRVNYEEKLKKGMTPCSCCFLVLTDTGICSFCRVERKYGA